VAAPVLSEEDLEHHQSRLDKALTQVIVLCAQKKKAGVFTCKSSQRNGLKYLVRIKSTPCCTCLDFVQGSRICKHIKKVLLKGYDVPEDSSILYATELEKKQLKKMGVDVCKCEQVISEETLSHLLSRDV